VSVRIQSSRDTSSVLPGVQFQRLLEADKHLLEGLHDEDLLLSVLHEAAHAGYGPGSGALHDNRLPVYLALARLPLALATGHVPFDGNRRVVLDDSRASRRREFRLGGKTWTSPIARRAEVVRDTCCHPRSKGAGDVRHADDPVDLLE